MPEVSKKAFLATLDTINFGEWEHEFEWKSDYLLLYRLRGDTMSPYYPQGSVIIADTRERWPRDGELYLCQFPLGTTGKKWGPQVAYISWSYNDGKAGFRIKDNRIETEYDKQPPRIRSVTQEEYKAQQVEWILGRVWGVLGRFVL